MLIGSDEINVIACMMEYSIHDTYSKFIPRAAKSISPCISGSVSIMILI